jgi:hypothetical protein
MWSLATAGTKGLLAARIVLRTSESNLPLRTRRHRLIAQRQNRGSERSPDPLGQTWCTGWRDSLTR